MSEILIRTQNYSAIVNLCADAHENSKMISIIGYPGAGKTTSLLQYAAGKSPVYYLRVTASMTARQFYAQILIAMGVEGTSKTANLHDLINHVCLRLNYDQTKQLLIIDEAGKFKPRFLEYLHELRDNTANSTGIVLAGPDYFHQNLKDWVGKGIVGVPEFYRRVQHWEYLSHPIRAEVQSICSEYKVEESKVIDEIYRTCRNFAEITDYIQNYLKLQSKLNK